MASLLPFLIAFDDGPTITVQPSSRDVLKLEKEGHDFESIGRVEGSYLLAFTTLQRYERQGKLPEGFTPPASAEALGEVADLDEVPPEDPEGKDTGQGPSTGS